MLGDPLRYIPAKPSGDMPPLSDFLIDLPVIRSKPVSLKLEYLVQSPFENRAKGLIYGLTKVYCAELDQPAVTASGLFGRVVQATIFFHNGKVWGGQAVWAEELDKNNEIKYPFDFWKGCEIALKRAIDESSMVPRMRKQVWLGFFIHTGQHFRANKLRESKTRKTEDVMKVISKG
jgi:hypothetical protein